MAEYLYKAYLSYSHADEAWATWLHKALEAYRVPSPLVGPRPDGSEVPARLTPIFRDRDDLSSAADLGEGLKQALRDSEALILICSPAAAASRWVNEEVRYFKNLGRAGRIFCMVVDGQPDAGAGAKSCFPPALFDGVNDAPAEPLAADPRPYADGKALARLKLVAGLLGVRLDELRRRDLKRKRRLQAIGAAAALAVISLAGLAITARMAEQRERQSAEQMASFIVDLGEDLKSEIDLASLSRISEKAMTYLEGIDPRRLQPETAIKVGLALRQIGHVSDGQGRSDDAREAFHRSRDLFLDMTERYPQREDLLFELGQAEFYVATHYFFLDQFDLAQPGAQRYADISRQLYEADPENPQWQLELSYAATGLLAMKVYGGGPYQPAILDEADQALQIAREVLQASPDDVELIRNYSTTLAWTADTRLLACELDEALAEREETLAMAARALEKIPSDNDSRESYAYAHTGVANVEEQMGRLDSAASHYQSAIDNLAILWRQDASNERVRLALQWRRLYLAGNQLDQENAQAARDLLDAIAADVPELEAPDQAGLDPALRMEYRVARAREALLRGQGDTARYHLAGALGMMSEAAEDLSRNDRYRLVEAQYLWWQMTGSRHEGSPVLALPRVDGLRSCRQALYAAQLAVMQGDLQRAAQETRYLVDKGYRGAGLARLCASHSLCAL